MKSGKSIPKGIPHNKIRKRQKFSSTPGKSKPNCVVTAQMKFAAKRSRSYLYSNIYPYVLAIWDRRSGKTVSKAK